MNALFYQLLGKWNHRQNVCFHVGSNLKRTSMLLIAFSFVLSALAAACTQPANIQNCVEEKCEMNDTEVCTQCKADGGAPYLKDGTCVTVDDCRQAAGYYPDDTTDSQNKKCMTCDSTCATCSGAGADKCTKCKPDAGDGKQYLKDGTCVTILGCAYDNEHYADDGTKECKVCNGGKRPDTVGTKCFSCPDKNCERCDQDNVCAKCNTGEPPTDGACPVAERGCHPSCGECTSDAMTNQADKCTSCKGDNYLRVIASGSGICIPASICASDKSYFAKEVAESTGPKKMCLSCSDATHGIADCKKCSSEASSAQTKLVLVCSDCDIKWLSPLGNACLEECPAGTYSERGTDNIGVCAPCHDTCAECDGNAEATSCRACYPGSVLSKGANGATGACIPECTGKYAENCADGQCTAVVGGSRYCSRCRAGFVPVDGVCVSATARAPTGCTPGNGVCTSCTATYFLESGGCYNARAFPGSTLCTTASDGKCTNCANGQEKDGQGSCPACPDGCSKCATSGSPKACSECLPGYYKSGNSCIKCDANDSQITGVSGCLSCAPPSGNQGSVICYITKDGGSGGGNTNKSGLSTGAIAGIAVAVVVVVGGLVGFLCWWFICRGKA
ncbi:VSP [Giardia lamblia P15]|uniref:VSP n=1 Tax=Giardia intestinalis (strain P15) TaxID=658858 RepID=E1F930_GIAIA|nr:VSP [Giardia lamblia P15]